MMSNWSSIIFATRKLTVLALKTLLQSMPSLNFLKVDGLMGYGGPVAAGSVTGKVRLWGLTERCCFTGASPAVALLFCHGQGTTQRLGPDLALTSFVRGVTLSCDCLVEERASCCGRGETSGGMASFLMLRAAGGGLSVSGQSLALQSCLAWTAADGCM